MAETAGSAYWVAKADCVLAEINIELRCFDAAAANIEQAAEILLEVSLVS
jgi:HEPN domain-containing protein